MSSIPHGDLEAAREAARQKASAANGGDRPRAWKWGEDGDGLELVGVVEAIEEDVPGDYGPRTAVRIALADGDEVVTLYLNQAVLAGRWEGEDPAVGDTVVIARTAELVSGKSRDYWGFGIQVIRASGAARDDLLVDEPKPEDEDGPEPAEDDDGEIPF